MSAPADRSRTRGGFTLLEAIIAMSIFAMVMTATLFLCRDAITQSGRDVLQTHTENQVQDAVDFVVTELKETSPSLRTSFDFTENGWTQTALVFPTARRKTVAGDPQSGKFVYADGTGKVQSQPQWQGIEVICFVSDADGQNGGLYKYVDYSSRNYLSPVTVAAVTPSQIRLSDGTTFLRGKRHGAPGANQARIEIPGQFVQVMTQGVDPVQLTIRAQNRDERLRSMVSTTLTNEALSRNHN